MATQEKKVTPELMASRCFAAKMQFWRVVSIVHDRFPNLLLTDAMNIVSSKKLPPADGVAPPRGTHAEVAVAALMRGGMSLSKIEQMVVPLTGSKERAVALVDEIARSPERYDELAPDERPVPTATVFGPGLPVRRGRR